jgi:hypothetical protein
VTNKHIHDKPSDVANRRDKYMEAVALRSDYSFGGRFNGPHVLTDSHGWTARCCGTAEGCKWCANLAAYTGAAPPSVAVGAALSRFMECDTCRAKSGSPTLCAGCLHNREVIEGYRRRYKPETQERIKEGLK